MLDGQCKSKETWPSIVKGCPLKMLIFFTTLLLKHHYLTTNMAHTSVYGIYKIGIIIVLYISMCVYLKCATMVAHLILLGPFTTTNFNFSIIKCT